MNQISETQTNEQEINGEMSVFLTDSILGPAHRQGIRKEESQSRSVVGFLSMERQLFFGPLARNCRRTLLYMAGLREEHRSVKQIMNSICLTAASRSIH